MPPSSTGLQGATCLVTGATAGIGRATACGLAAQGATVVLVARDVGRGEATRAAIAAATGNDRGACLLADLAAQASIRALADEFGRRYARLDVLVHSAAVFTRARAVSPDGLEVMFAINHLAPFLLTNLLLDRLRVSTPAAVLIVTAPATTRLDFDDLQGERRFSALHAFGASKMGNLLFTFALARRLAGSAVTVNAYHPGIVRTTLMRDVPLPLRWLTRLVGGSPERAAAGLVQLAATRANGQRGQLVHGGKVIAASAYARDEAVQERLWAASARLVGLTG